jgi:putative transposase
VKQEAKRKKSKRKRVSNKEKKRYSSDLTTAQWLVIKPLIPEAKSGGRPRTVNMREVFNAIFYRLKNGCTWENLPKDFPPHKTVFDYFRKFTLDGTIEKVHDNLRRQVRLAAGKKVTPTAGIIHSQSVKTTQKGGSAGTTQAKRQKDENVTFL